MTMTCEQASLLLSAYIDRELDVARSLDVEAHVRTCSRCAAVLEQNTALRAGMRSATLQFAPPAALEPRIRKGLRHDLRPRGRLAVAVWRWAAIPAAAALAAAVAWSVAVNYYGMTPRAESVLAELVSSHVRSLMVEHLVDVVSSDQHTVKPWFNGKVDFSPPVPDFGADGFPLIGGRVDYIGGRPVAVVVYKRRLHVINVFIWPSAKESGESSRELVDQGYHLHRWIRGGLTYWAVSDVNDADLETLAQLFAQAG